MVDDRFPVIEVFLEVEHHHLEDPLLQPARHQQEKAREVQPAVTPVVQWSVMVELLRTVDQMEMIRIIE